MKLTLRVASSPPDVGRLSLLRGFLLLGFLLSVLLALPAGALGAYSLGPDVQADGPESTPFRWSTQKCDDYHIPDTGTRAFRDAGGREQLVMSTSSFANPQGGADLGGVRRLYGSNLNNPAVDCTQMFLSNRNNDPSTFNNNEWMMAPFTNDGQTVNALSYDEYHGYEDRSPTNGCFDAGMDHFTPECWYSGITFTTSSNRGDSFSQSNPTVATIPYQYQVPSGPQDGFAVGYFQTTNVVRNPRDGYYYALFWANKYPKTGQPGAGTQEAGTCVMRTQTPATPSSWRGWGDGDGNGTNAFDVQFVNPYPTEPADKARHVCKGVISSPTADSLTWNRYFQRWMVTGYRQSGPYDNDVYYSLSVSPNDLTQWEAPRLLLDADMIFECSTGESNPILYPSALDNNSTTRNFDTTGQSFNVYFTRFNQASCDGANHRWTWPNLQASLNRDLVRVPVKFTRKPAGDRQATFEDGQIVNSSSGFDSATSSGGAFQLMTGAAYEGTNYVQATYFSGPNSPHGTINLPGWFNGTDVWYGSAFLLNGFANTHSNGTILEWKNAFGTSTGGIKLGTDHQWHLTHNAQSLGPSFSLPEGQWIWVEVHQKLESSAANGPLSEVFVNGRPVSSSAAVNANPDTDGAPVWLRAGLVSVSEASILSLDRVSTSWVQRGALGAPPTPTSLSGSEQDAFATLYWSGTLPVGGGFRVYRQNTDGTWSLRFDNVTTNGLFETGLTNCTRYHYRVSAFDAQGRESVVSEPLEIMPRGPGGCP